MSEITDEMLKAGRKAAEASSWDYPCDEYLVDIYLAMSKSSPIMKEDVVERVDQILKDYENGEADAALTIEALVELIDGTTLSNSVKG